MQPWIDQVKKTGGEAVASFKEELSRLRAGRSSSAMVERLSVDAYGSAMELRQIASITTPDARTILISPWDRGLASAIVKTLESASLGMQPNASDEGIRLMIPELTQERRAELIKTIGRISEEARVKVRKTRDEAWKDIQEAERKGIITEDDKFMLKEKLQKEVDAAHDKIEESRAQKEETL